MSVHLDARRFVLTEDHVKLLRASYVQWEDCEYGAAAIDCKRPYGNSDVVGDLCEMFGVEDRYDRQGNPAPETAVEIERLERLHRETELALQVVLSAGTFEPGEYVRAGYRQWVRAVNEPIA